MSDNTGRTNWSIVNPSDPCTFTASHEVAALVIGCLGPMYAANELGDDFQPLGEGRDVPFGLCGEFEGWYESTFGRGVGDGAEALRVELANALDSAMLGSAADRIRMQRVLSAISDPADRKAAEAAWHEEARSSLNDIVGRCRDLAASIRESMSEAEEGGEP